MMKILQNLKDNDSVKDLGEPTDGDDICEVKPITTCRDGKVRYTVTGTVYDISKKQEKMFDCTEFGETETFLYDYCFSFGLVVEAGEDVVLFHSGKSFCFHNMENKTEMKRGIFIGTNELFSAPRIYGFVINCDGVRMDFTVVSATNINFVAKDDRKK